MDEIIELKKRLEIAEKKIEVLEETFAILKNMNVSEQMKKYISKQQNVLNIVSLMNAVSDDEQINISAQEEALDDVKKDKQALDVQIEQAINRSADFLGDRDDYAKHFEYQPYEDGIEITAYIGFDNKEIIVPNRINGLSVVRIGDAVFENCKFEKVLLPDTLRELGDSVFNGCKSLKTIDLPESLIKIGDLCFSRCGFADVYINVETIPFGCFSSCKLNNVTIGKKVKIIEEIAFEHTAIQRIIIPENVIKLEQRVFNITDIKYVAFCGMAIDLPDNDSFVCDDHFYSDYIIYCLPGSDAQKYASQHDITVKPLSEFPKD